MSTYSAPSDDMQFVVKELIGLEEISQLPGFAEVTPDLVDEVIEEAGKFATGVLDPLNQPGDQHGAVLNEQRRDLMLGELTTKTFIGPSSPMSRTAWGTRPKARSVQNDRALMKTRGP